jgi:hypothetical protein
MTRADDGVLVALGHLRVQNIVPPPTEIPLADQVRGDRSG